MNTDKLYQLVRNIRDLKYPKELMEDVEAFEKKLAKDLDTDIQEAMALLGYLLSRDYVRIKPDMGLIVNPGNKDIQELITLEVL